MHKENNLRESTCAVRPNPDQGLGPLRQLQSHFRLGRTAASDQKALLHKRTHYAQRVVHGAIRLVQDQTIRATHQDGHRATHIRDVRELYDLHQRSSFVNISIKVYYEFE